MRQGLSGFNSQNALYKIILNMDNIKRTACQIFSRVNGWFTPINKWNKGKVSEWQDRKTYEVKETTKEDV